MKEICDVISEYPMRCCCNGHNPAATIESTCCDAIDRHCFFNALCDRGSLINCKIIANRHCFLVGPERLKRKFPMAVKQ